LMEELETAVKSKEKALEAVKEDAWLASRLGVLPEVPRDGLVAHYELEGSFVDLTGRHPHVVARKGEVTYPAGRAGRGANFDGETHLTLGDIGSGEQVTISAWIKPTQRRANTLIARAEYELAFNHPEVIAPLTMGSNLIVRVGDRTWRSADRVSLDNWHHLVFAKSGGEPAVVLDGKPLALQQSAEALPRIATALKIGDNYRGIIDDLRIYSRALNAGEIENLHLHYPVQMIASGAYGKPSSKEDKERAREYFLTYAADDSARRQFAELRELKEQKERLEREIPTVMIMSEKDPPRETHVLARGDYRNKTEKVEPGVPSVLPPLPTGAPKNRLTLAKWLTDPSHPLTSRVTVNRFWQAYFGHGLVKTSEDFGSQGEPPVNQELLDWLASEFVRSGWDVKAMQRLIVTSATYKQSSRATPELIEKDPENRLLARGPRFRLPAESVRDNALAIGGLLKRDIGGQSVFPYQPKGLWEEMAYGDVFSAQTYKESTGSDLYRRSMYTFWKRTVPPAQLATFDAPDREKCTGRRAVTNTPLQALILLNDPTYIDAAKALADRTIASAKDSSKRIAFAFEQATGRPPAQAESRLLRDLAAKQLAHYKANPKAAEELTGSANVELAAWTTVASTILNLDEVITKE
jgi:hypothetical protein